MNANTLEQKRFLLRRDVLDMIYRAKTGHIGGDYSACDILIALYYRCMNISPDLASDPKRDRFILSKGHCVEILYAILCDLGFFSRSVLHTYAQEGSLLIGHPNNKVPGIEMNTGSLGHGLPVAVGMALAGKLDHAQYRVYTLMGDGELAEGSIWEAAMAASHYRLDNLTAIIDRNMLQISGPTESTMHQEDVAARWESFGWQVVHANGHDLNDICAAVQSAKSCTEKPTIIIAHTVKGFGVSFMENRAEWHHKLPSPEEYALATDELMQKVKQYE